MFYNDSLSESYRLGDIVQGFSEILPAYIYTSSYDLEYIKFAHHDFFVILTPCCSIEKKIVSLVPLKKIESKFLASQYIRDDFLIINKPMKKREVVGDEAFVTKFTPEEQIILDNAPPSYEYFDKFIYDGYKQLKKYPIKKKINRDTLIELETNKYMISFKEGISIQCEQFERGTECKKCIELHPQTRQDLRKKLSSFYSRIPDEDKPFIM